MSSKKRDVVIGLGEIGLPIFKTLSKNFPTAGYDNNPKIMKKEYDKFSNAKTVLLHTCIPYSENFSKIILGLAKQYNPEAIVIHSTIKPYTTEELQKKLRIPIVYSATRGIHKRMLYDLKRYTKFYAVEPDAPKAEWVSYVYSKLMKKCGIKTKKMSNPLTLELAKIVVDTSYYGWLINYAQLSNMIAVENKVDYDEMWSFADEIHKYLGNRPKMYPGFIGGHCVIPNLDLIHNQTLDLIKKLNQIYAKKIKNSKSIAKKYTSK
ncbi:MAG: hypothetical protein E6L05_06050 [Thaumarchaeota archaeon]|nr:MAG: hypothetical protein E6L05_06050 [Nitrososphaerota archaeon]